MDITKWAKSLYSWGIKYKECDLFFDNIWLPNVSTSPCETSYTSLTDLITVFGSIFLFKNVWSKIEIFC